MKKNFLILALLFCGIASLSLFNNHSVAAEENNDNETVTALNNLIAQYVDETATYTKTTKIHLNEEAVNELIVNGGFHAGVSILERTTYYKGSELWMSSEENEGKMQYSYYGTAEGNTGVTNAVTTEKLVTPADAKVVLSGEGKNSMQEYYVGLEDIVAKNEHNWTVENGVYTSNDAEMIELFKAFTAPCYLGFKEETSNYISLDKVSISCDASGNLVLKLYATSDAPKFTSEDGVFSTATIDFTFNDAVWTDEVVANKFVFNQPEGNVFIDLYAVKAANGVHVKINYQTKELYQSNEWWKADNVEMRLNGPEGKIKSIKDDNEQWILSTCGYSNFTQFAYSTSAKNEETGLYTIVFDAFVSYDWLGINVNTPLGFTMGSNPGGKGPGNGWFQTEYFNTGDIALINKITETGILRYCLEDTCSHVFGEYHVVENATCSENGYEEAHCKYCNKVDTKVIESTGDHVYDEENVTVNTVSTCTEHGVGTVACGCGATKEVDLELDLTNHANHWNADTNTCACGSVVNDSVVDLRGSESFNRLRYEVDGSKDFEFDVILTQERAEGSTDWGNGFVGEVFSENWHNGGWSYRTDWHGWGSWAEPKGVKAIYSNADNGLWTGKFDEASANMTIIYNLKYDASENTITITMKYISHVEPFSSEVKELTYVCNNVMYKGKMFVAFGAQNAKVTYHYLKYSQGTEMVGPVLDGKMDDAHWTEEVKANHISVQHNAKDVKFDLYATRDEFAVYFFAKYQTKELDNRGGEWHQQDNIEMRLVANGKNVISKDTNEQWYVSRTKICLFDNAYVSDAVFNEETGYWEIIFEFYATNAHLGIDINSEVGFTYGINPGAWMAGPHFTSTDMNLINKVTVNGIQ